MTSESPIRVISELQFDNPRSGMNLNQGSPDYLRVSPNGRFIVIGSEGRYYLFDTRHPEQSWKEGCEKGFLEMVSPTDSGECWIEKCNDLLLVGIDNNVKYSFLPHEICRVWGNDDWLLIAKKKKLNYAMSPDFVFHTVEHKQTILHAWKIGDDTLRILSLSKNKKYILLHSWNIKTDDYQLLEKVKYKHDFGINGIRLCYLFTSHVHAFPAPDGSMIIKLMPWAVTVSPDNKITISDNHVAWSPIIDKQVDKKTSITHQKLAEITANMLEGELTSAGLGSTPYLITTLQTSTSVEVITSLGHKSISIKDIDLLSEHRLDQSLNDVDIATLVIANSQDNLPNSENLVSSISEMLESKSFKDKYEQLLIKNETKITELIKTYLLIEIEEIALKLGREKGEALEVIFEGLNEMPKYKAFPRVFFDTLDHPEIHKHAQHVVKSAICDLIPFIPEKVKQFIPDELTQFTEPIVDIIWNAHSDSAVFYLSKTPENVLNAKNITKLLQRFQNSNGVLYELFQKIGLLNKAEDLSKDISLMEALGSLLYKDGKTIPHILINMIKYDVPIVNTHDDQQINVIHTILDPQTTLEEIECLLCELDLDHLHYDPEIITVTLEQAHNKKLIPSHLFTMSEFLGAQSRTDLMKIKMLEDTCDSGPNENYVLLEKLWNAAKNLTSSSKNTYASCLLNAAIRCLGKQAVEDIALNLFEICQNNLITSEAKLLQASKATLSNPVIDMRLCLATE